VIAYFEQEELLGEYKAAAAITRKFYNGLNWGEIANVLSKKQFVKYIALTVLGEKFSGAFALLFFLYYKHMTIFRQNTENSSNSNKSTNQMHQTLRFIARRLTLILLMWRIYWATNSIPIYIQQDATLHSLFISGNCSTCFGLYFHPSSGAHTTVSTASGNCHTVTAICRYRGRVGNGLSVLWVVYATHSTLNPVPTLPR
jgi:glycerol uptake facilitator-like aquaporin